MKKRVLAALLCAMVFMTACGGQTSSSTEESTSSETTENSEAAGTDEEAAASGETQTLILSTFGLSEDISEEEIYGPFEEEYNCDIVTETGGASERYTKLSADSESTIDVIELSQAMAAQGAAEGLFLELDLDRLEYLDELLPGAQEIVEQGYGVPFTLNSIGIIYNRDLTGFDLTSFDDLWDSRLEGMISIPEISTTFGPAMVYMASDYAGVDIETDNGEAAFEALAELKPNLVKTYTKSADLINMFTSGEIAVAVVGNFGVPTIVEANPDLIFVTPDKTYANFNIMSINANCDNLDLAYAYLNYRMSAEVQTTTGLKLNDAPTNSTVEFTEEEAENMTYGETAQKAMALNYTFVNEQLESWTDQWNRIINN